MTDLVPARTFLPSDAIEVTPQELLEMSLLAIQRGQIGQARAGFEALRSNAALRAEALRMLGVVAGLEGNHAQAIALFQQAIGIDRSRPEYFANLASALGACGRDAEARSARNDLGVAFHIAGRYQEAAPVFEAILAEQPNSLATLVDLAATLQELREYPRALQFALRAIGLLRRHDPRIAPHLDALSERFPNESAAAARDIADGIDQAGADAAVLLAKALNNLGNTLIRMGQLDLAETSYRLANEIAPDEAIVRWNLSHLLLLRGDFEHGFPLYESRWQWPGFNFPERGLAKPQWKGESPGSAHLLVYAEQGFGDTIQFARFVPQMAARGARIWFEVQQELYWLMKFAFRSDPGAEVIPRQTDPRVVYGDPSYDAHCGVMSLIRYLQVKISDLPARMPYLMADPEAVTRWSEALGPRERPRVGVVWAGRPDHARDRERSIAFAQLSELFAISDVDWISVQQGPAASAAVGSSVRTPPGELRDFHETAALVQNLDLLITVDTAVAHLAGAMGKPAWILLPHIPDWRWLLDRSDSPWYPSVRLFRQRADGGWPEVMREVGAQLRASF
jgi:tetratricopeptide (TPR) repeat protein